MSTRKVDPELLTRKFYEELLSRHGIPPQALLDIFNKHGVDAVLVEQIFNAVLTQHRTLDAWGNKAALKRELERLVDDWLDEARP